MPADQVSIWRLQVRATQKETETESGQGQEEEQGYDIMLIMSHPPENAS
jgi:hypothetical protein